MFYEVLSLTFRFVVLHEIGHIVNDHGRRRARSGNDALLIDRPVPELLETKEAVQSQARELIADGFAFQHTIETFNSEISNNSHLELAQIVRQRLAPDAQSLISFVLSVVYLYFRLSDRADWQSVPVNQLSHPPAPFRMKALCALLHEKRLLEINEATAATIISGTLASGDALISVMLNIFPQPEWISQISTPFHDRHFGEIYQQFPNWSGRLT